jgi:hypothetical protein
MWVLQITWREPEALEFALAEFDWRGAGRNSADLLKSRTR